MIGLNHMINNILIRLVIVENIIDTIQDGLMNNLLEGMNMEIQHMVDKLICFIAESNK